MFQKTYTIKFRVPKGSPEGTKPRDSENVTVSMPDLAEYPEGFLQSLVDAEITNFIRVKLLDGKEIADNVVTQYITESASTRGPAISEETWAAATESFKGFWQALGKSEEVVSSLVSAFKGGFRTRYSPAMATKIQIGLHKWYAELPATQQEAFEVLADKLDKKLESYLFEDTSVLEI